MILDIPSLVSGIAAALISPAWPDPFRHGSGHVPYISLVPRSRSEKSRRERGPYPSLSWSLPV